jgi:hypothetical protein
MISPFSVISVRGAVVKVTNRLMRFDAYQGKRSHRWAPIHLSAEYDHLGLVKPLLERGADVHAMNDEGGKSNYRPQEDIGRWQIISSGMVREGERFDLIDLWPTQM